jgi:hypothetical protein
VPGCADKYHVFEGPPEGGQGHLPGPVLPGHVHFLQLAAEHDRIDIRAGALRQPGHAGALLHLRLFCGGGAVRAARVPQAGLQEDLRAQRGGVRCIYGHRAAGHILRGRRAQEGGILPGGGGLPGRAGGVGRLRGGRHPPLGRPGRIHQRARRGVHQGQALLCLLDAHDEFPDHGQHPGQLRAQALLPLLLLQPDPRARPSLAYQ